MANSNMKRYSTSLAIREIRIKITMRFHLTPVGMVSSTEQIITSAGEVAGEKGTLLHYW